MTPSLGGQAILHLLPWLDHGGVEWYVIRLAAAQAEAGCRVIVAGGGGALEPELRAAGIPYHHLPLAGRHMPAAVWRLWRLITRERVGLVAAHNWRAGTVGALAARLAGVPFILTVHGLRHPAQRFLMPGWGRCVLTVSPECREHLVRRFHLRPEQVLLVPVGVDTRRFRPAPPEEGLARELGVDLTAPVVVHASRLSHSKAGVALALCEAMPALNAGHPGVQVLIVGNGSRLERVRVAAAAANRRLGRGAVSCLAGRGDVDRLLSLADAVVGGATVALEGLACGKPVVAAGKGGYFGPLTPDNLEAAAKCHFGDHGRLAPVTPEALVAGLGRALEASPGDFGVAYVRSRHSTAAMSEAVAAGYGEALGLQPDATVLVFHMNQVGDLVFSLPVLAGLRRALPQGRIVSVAPASLAPLLQHSPFVDEVVTRTGSRLPEICRLAARLRQERAQAALGISQSPLSSLLMWLSGALQRIGYCDSSLRRLLTTRVQWRGIPCPAKMAAALSALAIAAPDGYQGLLHLGERDREEADQVLATLGVKAGTPLAVLAAGASGRRGYKTWPAGRFAEVGEGLARAGWQVVVVGGAAEAAAAGEMASRIPGGLSLAGKTGLGVLAALLGKAGLFVGGDSGPLHLAAAMGTPTVAIFGPTDPALTAPQGPGHQVLSRRLACAPCQQGCKDRPCLLGITAEEVLAAAGRLAPRPVSSQST